MTCRAKSPRKATCRELGLRQATYRELGPRQGTCHAAFRALHLIATGPEVLREHYRNLKCFRNAPQITHIVCISNHSVIFINFIKKRLNLLFYRQNSVREPGTFQGTSSGVAASSQAPRAVAAIHYPAWALRPCTLSLSEAVVAQ